MLVEGSVWVRP